MKRKELRALFSEVSSKCSPVRGIYSIPSTESERKIKSELAEFKEKALEKKSKEGLEKLFNSQAPTFTSSEEFKAWFLCLKEIFSLEEIPDTIYAQLMAVSDEQQPDSISNFIRQYLNQAP